MDGTQTKQDLNKFRYHLNSIKYEIQLNGGYVRREHAIHEYFARRARESGKQKLYKLPIVGKRAYKNTIHTYPTTSEMYLLMVYLMQDFDMKYLTESAIDKIIQKSDEIYEKHYKYIDIYSASASRVERYEETENVIL